MPSTQQWTKAKTWKGNDLKGVWEFTIKIDGVRCFWTSEGWVSRAGKPLYNIPHLANTTSPCQEGYEAYRHDPKKSSKENFKATIKAVRAKNKPERMLEPRHLYRLGGDVGPLLMGRLTDPTAAHIEGAFTGAIESGYEGIVMRGPKGEWLRVKTKETYDVTVIGCIEGVGKHKGRLGALVTTRGKVGTGFSDKEREDIWANECAIIRSLPGPELKPYKGARPVRKFIIEVSFMNLTADGKFRQPRFERIRTDKVETDDPT